jgi:DnaK suppressor protein
MFLGQLVQRCGWQGSVEVKLGGREETMATTLDVEGARATGRPDGDARKWRERIETLLRERRRASQGPPAAFPAGPDPVDAARDQEEEAVWLAVLDHSRDVQTTVEEALRRLATGQYGLCVECGQHIALARLRALPFAIRCLSCQERFERGEEVGRVAPTGRPRGFRFAA